MIGGKKFLNGLVEVFAGLDVGFELGGDKIEALGDDGVEHGIGAGNIGAGTDGAELELVAGEGKRAGAVSIAGVLGQLGKNGNAGFENTALLAAFGGAFFDLFENVGELLAEEDGNDRRRRFVGAEAVIVVGAGDREAENLAVLADGADNGGTEDEELGVVMRRVAGIKEVFALVGGHGPVVVLTAAVDAGERLFMEQADQAVLVGGAPHHFHDHVLVIGGEVAVLEQRRQFVLAGGNFVVAGFDRERRA